MKIDFAAVLGSLAEDQETESEPGSYRSNGHDGLTDCEDLQSEHVRAGRPSPPRPCTPAESSHEGGEEPDGDHNDDKEDALALPAIQ
jgi:hypothetical protein